MRLSKTSSFLSIVLSLTILFSVVFMPSAKVNADATITQDAYEYIHNQIEDRTSTIDLSSFEILVSSNGDTNEADLNIRDIMVGVHNEFIDSFVVTSFEYEIMQDGSNIYLSTLTFEYGEGYDMDLFYSYVDDALSRITPDMSDFAKALVLHDYLLSHTAYNLKDLDNGSITREDTYAYKTLVEQKTICLGYARTYHGLLNMAGVESYIVLGEETSVDPHAWVMVVIDGEPYHVELTSDDPNYDVLGRVWHGSFLVSDNTIREMLGLDYKWSIHDYERTISLEATSDKYDSYYWRGIDSPMCYYNGNFYFSYHTYSNEKFYYTISYNPESAKTGEPITLVKWLPYDNGAESWNWASMVEIIDGRIYYNTSQGINSCGVDSKDNREEYLANLPEGYSIYGAQYRDNNFYYTIAQTFFINEADDNYILFTDDDKVYQPEEEIVVPEETEEVTTEPETTEETDKNDSDKDSIADDEETEETYASRDSRSPKEDSKSNITIYIVIGVISLILTAVIIVVIIKKKSK